MSQQVRALCFYLPQYHPIPENDEWWGKGFTEWRNVVTAGPLFSGHQQPHLPRELGFYDLRAAEVREAQAMLARDYGVFGFCYYHYWFNGRRILDRPFEEVIATGQPSFPFCLCWANENWTRTWDGEHQNVLLQQHYSPDDDVAHIRSLARYFADARYIHACGRPVFLVYRPSNLPDPAGTVHRWRVEAERLNLPGLYLCAVESVPADKGLAKRAGFDAAVEFAPDWECLPPVMRPLRGIPNVVRRRMTKRVWWEHRVCDYRRLRDRMLAKPMAPYTRFPGVTPAWDNSARRKTDATILHYSSPSEYRQWLSTAIERFIPPSADENFVFINAWNEWAEGNHLEPCLRWGRGYLEATRDALRDMSVRGASKQ